MLHLNYKNTVNGFDYMNELSKLFLNIKNGYTVKLKKDYVYHVSQEDSFHLTGFYCSNTAKKNENPAGTRKAAIFLENKRDITIDGNGATIMIHGKMTPLVLYKCHNVKITNLTIDYACPTMSEFDILENNNGKCKIKIHDDCLYRMEGDTIIWHGEIGSDGKPYWEQPYVADKRHLKLYDTKNNITKDINRNKLKFNNVMDLGDNVLELELEDSDVPFRAGCTVQTRNIVRDQTGALFERCGNLHFENLRVMFMHGLGMVSQYCENVTYLNCNFNPKENRTAASTADFFQFSGCKGTILIENCQAKGAHDDFVNVHGTHLQITEADYEHKRLVVCFKHDESWGFQAFDKGDTIDFIKWNTLIPFGTNKVKPYNRLDDTHIELFLENDISPIEIGKDVIENATCTPDLIVRNCTFGLTAGRGILCTTRGEIIIENNTFEGLWGPALLIEDDCNFWFESGYTKTIIFRNNTIIGCDYGKTYPDSPTIRYSPKVMKEDSTEFVHGELILYNNIFRKCYGEKHCINLEYLRSAEICDNTFDKEYKVNQKCVGEVIIKNNIIL